jgi:hypothetical protein
MTLWKRDRDRAAVRAKVDRALVCLAKSVGSIVVDNGVADKDAMLAKSFGQFLQHVSPGVSIRDVARLHAVFKNDSESSERDLSDEDVGFENPAADDDEDDEGESDTGGESTDQLERAERAMKMENNMKSHSELMSDVVKKYGIVAFCKSVAQGDVAVSEHRLTELINEHAAREKTTFSKLFDKPEIWKAVQAARDAQWLDRTSTMSKAAGMPGRATLTPRVTGGRAARAVDNPKSALEELQSLVDAQRAQHPALSESEAWLAVYTHPDNQELARREREENRPVAWA